MRCDVCIGTDDYEQAEFYQLENRKARKPHKCYECRRAIQPGEKYEHVRAKWDGDFSTIYTCGLCAEIRTVFSCGEGYCHGSLWDDMYEIAFPALTTASECFTELSATAKARVLEEWRKWKGLQ